MLKQKKTYLPVSNRTISNLDLSHYYLLKLKITKSGWSVHIASASILLARPPNFGAPQNHTEFLHTYTVLLRNTEEYCPIDRNTVTQ
jgi:hypothetical protein